ncbi:MULTISPECIES: Maf family protein [unclassified Paenibacillus]|uniref:Maf family protein n=1 Tax=unclassified Paenibacillus TaxID=185978 RepID=UPI000956AA28|nr:MULTISPECIES: Maf family protein [unclassified Paenibacillus]ASS66332.1 septum formation protein Maf [Paenibacillus sp. RUD330]SIQ07516.1 septum formation protein [Paenibacillus sp. RU4X]SIQ27571.1 septum formation protein [Paenibacillus sp. RU4T]
MNDVVIPDRLVLASASPRRRELVAVLGLELPVRLLPTGADESVAGTLSPGEIVLELSRRKAEAAAGTLRGEKSAGASAGNDLVLGADTIVVLDGAVLGKPADREDAVSALMALSGRTHEVYTGVTLLACPGDHAVSRWQRTLVTMKPFGIESARRYAATGEPLDKAGSYGIQGLGGVLVEKIEGCYTNVVGLPLPLLADMLAEYGIYVI